MLAALAFATVLAAPQTVTLLPTDDIWVYPHASDPEHDVYLRAWGAEGLDVPKNSADLQDYSFSYLKFDASKIPAGKITEAKLVLMHVADPGYALDYAKDNPLRVRPVKADFTEKSWDYSKAEDYMPEAGAQGFFGSAFPTDLGGGKPFTLTVDLLKGPKHFAKAVEQARSGTSHSLALALTATMDVEAMGQKCIYKFFSKDAETAANRPLLKITVETP